MFTPFCSRFTQETLTKFHQNRPSFVEDITTNILVSFFWTRSNTRWLNRLEYDRRLFRFVKIHSFDRRTDRQTDSQNCHSKTACCIAVPVYTHMQSHCKTHPLWIAYFLVSHPYPDLSVSRTGIYFAHRWFFYHFGFFIFKSRVRPNCMPRVRLPRLLNATLKLFSRYV